MIHLDFYSMIIGISLGFVFGIIICSFKMNKLNNYLVDYVDAFNFLKYKVKQYEEVFELIGIRIKSK